MSESKNIRLYWYEINSNRTISNKIKIIKTLKRRKLKLEKNKSMLSYRRQGNKRYEKLKRKKFRKIYIEKYG